MQYFKTGQLDYELVLRDQRMEATLDQVPRKVKVQLRNFLTKRYPEVPISSFTNYTKDKDDREAPDRHYMMDHEGNVIVDVVMKQYMKQQLEQERAWKRDLSEKMRDITSYQTEATKLQREGIHNHCRTCVITDCSIGKKFDPSRWRESCPIVDCRWGCGAKYHQCKSQDHSFLCKLYVESDEMDWLRRLQTKSVIEIEEDDFESSSNNYKVSVSPQDINLLPELSQTLIEPTHLDVNIETVHRMHVKPLNIRSFICGKVFRRDEIHQHIINIHQEIIPGLGSSWISSRCPLAYLGCPFAVDNLAPNSTNFRIQFSRLDDDFCCQHIGNKNKQKTSDMKKDEINKLPIEILCYILEYLDPISIRSLSLTCKGLRELCGQEVRTKGCVSMVWEKQRARGQRRQRTGWVVVSHKWFYSTAMTKVTRWVSINISDMQRHLSECRFNERNTVSTSNNAISNTDRKLLLAELKKRVEMKKQSNWFIS